MNETVLYVSAMGAISGAERSLLALLDALDRTRWAPVVAAPAGPLLQEAAARGASALALPLAPLSRPHSPRQWLSVLHDWRTGRHALARALERVRPRLIHANTTAAMLYAGGQAEIPVIWQVRDLVPLGWIGRRAYWQAAAIAAISLTVRNDLLAYANDGGAKISLLPPAVDTAHFQPAAAKGPLRRQLELPDDVPLIGMSAQFVAWKRHHLLFDALARLSALPWHLALAGADLHGHRAYLDALRVRMQAPPLAGRVTLLPWQQDPAAYTAALDLCVLTSHREPFGRVLIEAMACEVPVVAVREGGPAEIVADGVTGLLAPPDPEALGAALARLLDDAALRRRLGQAGRLRVLDRYSLERQRDALQALYAALTD